MSAVLSGPACRGQEGRLSVQDEEAFAAGHLKGLRQFPWASDSADYPLSGT